MGVCSGHGAFLLRAMKLKEKSLEKQSVLVLDLRVRLCGPESVSAQDKIFCKWIANNYHMQRDALYSRTVVQRCLKCPSRNVSTCVRNFMYIWISSNAYYILQVNCQYTRHATTRVVHAQQFCTLHRKLYFWKIAFSCFCIGKTPSSSHFGGAKNGTSGARIKIQTSPQNPHHLRNQNWTWKSIFGHFINFAYFYVIFL